MTAREAILEKLATLLGTVSGATFYRSRASAVARSEGIALILAPEEETVEDRTMDLQVCKLVALVTVLARGDVPDQVADPVVQAAHAAIMSDRTLGNLCSRVIALSTKWAINEADLTATAMEMRFHVTYMTLASDLSTPL